LAPAMRFRTRHHISRTPCRTRRCCPMDTLYQPDSRPSLSTLVWRHKGKMLATFLVVVAGGLVYLALDERTYQSEAKMFIRPGRETVTLDPIVTNGQAVTMTDA